MAGAATFQACANVHHPGRSCQTNTQEVGHGRVATFQACAKVHHPGRSCQTKTQEVGHGRSYRIPSMCRKCTTLAEVAIQTSKKWEMAGAATFQACAEVHHPGRNCQTNTQELGWKQLSANWGKPAIALRGFPLMSLPQSSLFSIGQVSRVVPFLVEVLVFQKKEAKFKLQTLRKKTSAQLSRMSR